jgi:heme/copper-type cytochrome/quinol oxidase subunit 2
MVSSTGISSTVVTVSAAAYAAADDDGPPKPVEYNVPIPIINTAPATVPLLALYSLSFSLQVTR